VSGPKAKTDDAGATGSTEKTPTPQASESATPKPETTPKTAPEANKPSEAEARIKALEDERDRLKNELKDVRDKFLRARADYENYAKRAAKEAQHAIRTNVSGLLLRVIEASETLEKGLAHLKTEKVDTKGIQMVADGLKRLLKDEGVRAIETDGTPFNYRYHTAVDRTPTAEKPDGTILETYQRGYLMGDLILRPAMVRVAVPPTHPKPAATQAADPEKPANP
jgi:molecular chaperone GrpE